MKHFLLFSITLLSMLNHRLNGQSSYENTLYGYTGQVPSDWTIYAEIKDDPENHASIMDWGLPKVFSKLEKTSIENAISITAYKNPAIKNIDDLVKYEFNRVAGVLESKEKAGDSPYQAYVVNSVRNGHKYKGRTAFAFQNGIGYVFIYTATPGTYDINLSKFDDFLKHVKLTVPKAAEPTALNGNHPKFDGLYVSKTGSVKVGDQVMDIYMYLRFYADGSVYTQSVNAYVPEKVSKWMGREGRFERKGNYTMSGSAISFTVNNDGTEDKAIEGPMTDVFTGKLADENKLFVQMKLNSGNQKDVWFEFVKSN